MCYCENFNRRLLHENIGKINNSNNKKAYDMRIRILYNYITTLRRGCVNIRLLNTNVYMRYLTLCVLRSFNYFHKQSDILYRHPKQIFYTENLEK